MDKILNKRGKQLLEFIGSREMVVLNGRTKGDSLGGITFVNANGKSIIDYAIVSEDLYRYVEDFFVLELFQAEHFPIAFVMNYGMDVCLDGNKPSGKEDRRIIWNNKEADNYKNKLNQQLQNLSEFDHLNNVDCLSMLVEFIIKASEETNMLVPCRFKTTNYNSLWFDENCRAQKKEVGKLLKNFRISNSQKDRKLYIKCRIKYRKTCETKKDEYWKNVVDKISMTRDNGEFWKLIKKLNYKILKSNNIELNVWFDYYKEQYMKSGLIIELKFPLIYDEVLDKEITKEELMDSVRKLKLGKAPGWDKIIPECIKFASWDFLEMLLKLYNRILLDGNIPDNMTKLLTCPIYKKGDPMLMTNYRPITLVSVLTKILGSILCSRLENWVNENKILHETQAGFRRRYSTIDNIFVLYTMIYLKIHRKRGKLYALFVDMSRAFDSINHVMLWNKMGRMGVSTRFIKLLKNYYEKALTFVKTNSIFQSFIEVQRGVLQGDPLSPLLFNLFLSDLPNKLETLGISGVQMENMDIHCLLYADDMVLLADTPIGLQKKIDILDKYFQDNGMMINIDKSKIVIFSNGNRITKRNIWRWKSLNMNFEIVSKYDYLGVPIVMNGNIKKLFTDSRNKASLAINKIWTIKNRMKTTNLRVMTKLFNATVLSVLSYAGALWGSNEFIELERFQLNFYKRILSSPRYTPGYLIRFELGITKLQLNFLKLVLNYWLKISRMEEDRLPYKCFQILVRCSKNSKQIGKSRNWVTDLNSWLNRLGYSYLCNSLDDVMIQNNIHKILQTYFDISIQQDANRILGSNYNKYYQYIKQDIMPDRYLQDLSDLKYVKLIFNLRIHGGKLLLMQNTFLCFGGDLCTLCDSKQVNSFFHMFIQCTLYRGILLRYINKETFQELSKFGHYQYFDTFVYKMLELIEMKTMYLIFVDLLKVYNMFNENFVEQI